jgi:hypothetical protein
VIDLFGCRRIALRFGKFVNGLFQRAATVVVIVIISLIGGIAIGAQSKKEKKDLFSWCSWSFSEKLDYCVKSAGNAGRCGDWVQRKISEDCK